MLFNKTIFFIARLLLIFNNGKLLKQASIYINVSYEEWFSLKQVSETSSVCM